MQTHIQDRIAFLLLSGCGLHSSTGEQISVDTSTALPDHISVNGEVRYQGTAVPEAEVVLIDSVTQEISALAATDADGTFRFEIATAGEYLIAAKVGDDEAATVFVDFKELTVTGDAFTTLDLYEVENTDLPTFYLNCTCRYIYWRISYTCCTGGGWTECFWGWGC